MNQLTAAFSPPLDEFSDIFSHYTPSASTALSYPLDGSFEPTDEYNSQMKESYGNKELTLAPRFTEEAEHKAMRILKNNFITRFAHLDQALNLLDCIMRQLTPSDAYVVNGYIGKLPKKTFKGDLSIADECFEFIGQEQYVKELLLERDVSLYGTVNDVLGLLLLFENGLTHHEGYAWESESGGLSIFNYSYPNATCVGLTYTNGGDNDSPIREHYHV